MTLRRKHKRRVWYRLVLRRNPDDLDRFVVDGMRNAKFRKAYRQHRPLPWKEFFND
jgi:hypothetical protein